MGGHWCDLVHVLCLVLEFTCLFCQVLLHCGWLREKITSDSLLWRVLGCSTMSPPPWSWKGTWLVDHSWRVGCNHDSTWHCRFGRMQSYWWLTCSPTPWSWKGRYLFNFWAGIAWTCCAICEAWWTRLFCLNCMIVTPTPWSWKGRLHCCTWVGFTCLILGLIIIVHLFIRHLFAGDVMCEIIRWQKDTWSIQAFNLLAEHFHRLRQSLGWPQFIPLLQQVAAQVGMHMSWIISDSCSPCWVTWKIMFERTQAPWSGDASWPTPASSNLKGVVVDGFTCEGNKPFNKATSWGCGCRIACTFRLPNISSFSRGINTAYSPFWSILFWLNPVDLQADKHASTWDPQECVAVFMALYTSMTFGPIPPGASWKLRSSYSDKTNWASSLSDIGSMLRIKCMTLGTNLMDGMGGMDWTDKAGCAMMAHQRVRWAGQVSWSLRMDCLTVHPVWTANRCSCCWIHSDWFASFVHSKIIAKLPKKNPIIITPVNDALRGSWPWPPSPSPENGWHDMPAVKTCDSWTCLDTSYTVFGSLTQPRMHVLWERVSCHWWKAWLDSMWHTIWAPHAVKPWVTAPIPLQASITL